MDRLITPLSGRSRFFIGRAANVRGGAEDELQHAASLQTR